MRCNPPFSAGATSGAFHLTGGSYKLILHQMCVRLTFRVIYQFLPQKENLLPTELS